MLGRRNSIGSGRIDDEAAMLGGGGKIDIVDADASAADDLEAADGGFEDLSGDFGAATDDQGVAEGDLGAEFLVAEVVGAVDVGEAPQELEPGLTELLRDEDRRLGAHGEDYDQRSASGAARKGGKGGEARWERDAPWFSERGC